MKQKNKADFVKLILLMLVFYRFIGTGDCQASQVDYYGVWKVDHVIGFAHISAGSDLAVRERGGEVLVLSYDYAINSNLIIEDPIYFEKKYSEEEFFKYNRAFLRKLGINSDFIYFIKVKGKNGEEISFYYASESDTLIVCYEGVFLAAVRIRDKIVWEVIVPKNATASSFDSQMADSFSTFPIMRNQKTLNNKIFIEYPQFIILEGDLNTPKIKKINKLISDQIFEELGVYYPDITENITINISYKTNYKTSDVLSIQYQGVGYIVDAPYPKHLFFTTNIDLNTGERICLNDFIDINNDFTKQLQKRSILQSENYQLKKWVFENWKSMPIIELEKLLSQADQRGKGIFTYFTPTTLGVSIAVPHALGDHIEFEIEYQWLSEYVREKK